MITITKDMKKNKKKYKKTLNEYQDNGQALNTMSELAENTLKKKKKKKRKMNSFDNERIENNDRSMFHLENEQSGSFEMEFTESLDVRIRKNKSKKRKRTIFPGADGQVCHDASCHDDDKKPKKQKLGLSLSLENELDNPDFGNKIKHKAKGSCSLSDVDVKAGIDVDVTMNVDTTKHNVTHSPKKGKKSKNILEVSCTEEKNTAQASDDRDAEDTTHTLKLTSQFDDTDNTINNNNNNRKKKHKKKMKQDLASSLDAHGWDTTHSFNGQNDDKDKIIKKKSKKKVKQDLASSLDAHGWDTTHSFNGQEDDQENNSIKKKKKIKHHLDSSLDTTTKTFLNTPYQDINSQVGDQENIVIAKKKSKKKAMEGLYLSPNADIVGCSDGHFRKKKKKSKIGSIMDQYNLGGDDVVEGMTGDQSLSPVTETRLGCEVTDEHLKKKKKMKKGNKSNRHISRREDILTSRVCSDGLNDGMDHESYSNDFPSDKSLLGVSSLSIIESCPDSNIEQSNQDVGRPKENEQASRSKDDYDFDDSYYSVSYRSKAKKMGCLRAGNYANVLYFDDEDYYSLTYNSRRPSAFPRQSYNSKNRTFEERLFEFTPGVGIPQEEIEDIPLSHCHWTLVQETLVDNVFTKTEIEEDMMGKINYLRDYFKRLEMGQLTEEELKERRPTHYNHPYLPTPQHLKFFENLDIKITWKLSKLNEFCLFNTLGRWFRKIIFEEIGVKVKSQHASFKEDLQLLSNWQRFQEEYKFYDVRPLVSLRTCRVWGSGDNLQFPKFDYIDFFNRKKFALYLLRDIPERDPAFAIERLKTLCTYWKDNEVVKYKRVATGRILAKMEFIMRRFGSRDAFYASELLIGTYTDNHFMTLFVNHMKLRKLKLRDGRWTKEEDARLVYGIKKVMNVQSIEEVLDKKIPWIKIMPYVKTRRYNNLRQRFVYRMNKGDWITPKKLTSTDDDQPTQSPMPSEEDDPCPQLSSSDDK